MENNKNSVQLTGFAGNNPEIKSFGSDKKMARLSIGLSAFSKSTANDNQVQWFAAIMICPATKWSMNRYQTTAIDQFPKAIAIGCLGRNYQQKPLENDAR